MSIKKKDHKPISQVQLAGITVDLHHRNDSLFDGWSVVHLLTGIVMGWVMSPFVALALMVLWEPFEILVLSPLLARIGITFGYETLRNSLSDILFDTVGVCVGAYVLSRYLPPPFYLI